jgi:NHLM bacteriocin system ABC transporter peptidase/ATP-binding protein
MAVPSPPGSRTFRRVRTPTLLQMETVECGAAALGIVLGYHGRFVPLEELRVECGVSRDGSKASNVVKAARRYGLEAKGLRKEPADLRQLTLPFIVFWNFNHFVVVEGFGKGRVYLNDPALGPRAVSDQEFDTSFTGVVLHLMPGADFQRGGRRSSVLASLRQRLAGARLGLTYVVLAGLALVVPGMTIPIFGTVFVDQVIVAGRHDWLGPLLLAMVVVLLLGGVLTWLQLYHLTRLETKLAVGSSAKFLWHVLRLPVEFFTQRYAGDVASRVGSNDTVAGLLSGELATTVVSLASVLVYVVLMLQYDVTLTLLGASVALASFLALRAVARRRIDQSLLLQQDQGKLLAITMNSLQVIESLKASAAEGDCFQRWAGYQAKVVSAEQALAAATELLLTVPAFLSLLTGVLILGAGGLRVMDGQLSMGELLALQLLMTSFLAPVNQLVALGGTLQTVHGDLGRLDDVLRYRLDPTAADGEAEPGGTPRLSGHVVLRNVTFGYSRVEAPLIRGFDLELRPGSRVALVGGSGSGKSTIARLIAGLVEPWEGEVLFDGRARAQIPRALLTNSLALVDQDIALFAGTVRDNLTLWDETVAEAAVVRAARDACIHDEVAARPGGYASDVLEGGANFSGGQRQRLEIARALVGDPSILVLDEATSALDPLTEQVVDDNLRRRGCTCVLVAHRLSTIRDCDEILVLEHGQVVQRGTHEELMAAGGVYASLLKAE